MTRDTAAPPGHACLLDVCPQNATFANAVVGGTGIYNGASGTVNVTVLEGNRWSYGVQLLQQPNCTST